MTKIIKTGFLALMLFWGSMLCPSNAEAQRPSIQDLIQNVDNAAARVEEENSRFLGFKRLQLPKPLAGLVDIKFRKPQLPKFGFLDKLKSIGQPKFDAEGTESTPFLSGLGKLFTPPPKTGPGFFDRMLGRSGSSQSLIPENEMAEINNIARDLQAQAGRMSREAQSSVNDLFGGNATQSPQPPLRSARQYTGGNSRY